MVDGKIHILREREAPRPALSTDAAEATHSVVAEALAIRTVDSSDVRHGIE